MEEILVKCLKNKAKMFLNEFVEGFLKNSWEGDAILAGAPGWNKKKIILGGIPDEIFEEIIGAFTPESSETFLKGFSEDFLMKS